LSNIINISIVIVNYNVKDFLRNCLDSIYNSDTNLIFEIIVVDNNSHDDSFEELSKLYKDVKFILLKENLGFSKANNIGFAEASGEFVLILNPDTILSADTLHKVYHFMKSNPEIGASGCKVLNHDNTFQLPCRRSFPTPWNSFCKLFGLQKIFPNTKLFSEYNLTYKSIDESYEVDALIGAFMFVRNDVIDKINGFDEEYFMYGEDLDFCYKVKKAGYKVYYFHETSIIHFKGESTKRSNINEVKHFYDAMQIFVKKHYSSSFLFLTFLKTGIKVREILSYLIKFRRDILFITIDILLVLILFPIANKLRYGYSVGYPAENYDIYSIVLVLFALIAQFLSGNYFERDYRFRKNIVSGLMMMMGVGFFIYLIRGFDLSRIVLFITTTSFITLSYLIRSFISSRANSKSKFTNLIVGNNELSEKIVEYFKINKIPYSTISNENDLFNVVKNSNSQYEILVCDNSDILDLKHNLKEYQENINSLIQINDYQDFIFKFSISKTLNSDIIFKKSDLDLLRVKFIKRILDIFVSLLLLSVALLFLLFKKASIKNIFQVLIGKKTLIGIYKGKKHFNYKEGLYSLVALNSTSLENDIDELNKYYINNYSLTLDFDIFVKSFFKKKG